MIGPKEILFKNVFSSKEDNMVHSTFYYPKLGGSQFIVNRLCEGINLKNEQIKKIGIQNKKIKTKYSISKRPPVPRKPIEKI